MLRANIRPTFYPLGAAVLRLTDEWLRTATIYMTSAPKHTYTVKAWGVLRKLAVGTKNPSLRFFWVQFADRSSWRNAFVPVEAGSSLPALSAAEEQRALTLGVTTVYYISPGYGGNWEEYNRDTWLKEMRAALIKQPERAAWRAELDKRLRSTKGVPWKRPPTKRKRQEDDGPGPEKKKPCRVE